MVRHLEHGWIYVQPAGNWLWLWDYQLAEWLSTGELLYPMIYESETGTWLWYFEGTSGPRWFSGVDHAAYYAEYQGVLMPEMMRRTFEAGTELSSGMADTDMDEAMTEVLGLALLPIIGDPATLDCPEITRTPLEVNLFDMPESIVARADFGNGCEPAEGLGVLSGSLDISLTDFVMSGDSLGMNLDLVFSDLLRDGLAYVNGALSVVLSIENRSSESETETEWITTTNADLSGELVLDNLVVLDSVLGGAVNLSGTLQSIAYEDKATWEERETTSGQLVLTMENLVSEYADVASGTVQLDLELPGVTSLQMQMETSEGVVDMGMTVEQSADGQTIRLNSLGEGEAMGYSIRVDDLRWDMLQCEGYPVGGSIRIGWRQAAYVITFTGDCDGSYSLRRE
jgi:hypothetical protein